MPKPRSTRDHWQAYWSQVRAAGVQDTYSTDGRVLREVLRATNSAPSRLLEIGAGSGRDACELVSVGVRVVTLDSSEASLGLTTRTAREAGAHVVAVGGCGV